MRKKKWLLIAVAILFLINLAFFILIRLAKVDLLVKDKISNVLSSKLNAHVNIGDFTMSNLHLVLSMVGFAAIFYILSAVKLTKTKL